MGNLILGIDPGLSGALAVYNPVDKLILKVIDMPLKSAGKTTGKKMEVDAVSLSFFVEGFFRDLSYCVVEKVHAMPHQGVVSMFRFGQSLGVVEGVLGAYFLPILWVYPQVWKTQMGLSYNKETSRAMAEGLFPANRGSLLRKKDDGRAEAMLLAVYGSLYKDAVK